MKFNCLVALALLGSLPMMGCGSKPENQVIVDPNADSAAQQQAYDDYDKQMAADSANQQ